MSTKSALKVEQRIFVEWTAKKPARYSEENSPNFTFQGCECYLELHKISPSGYIEYNLQIDSKSPSTLKLSMPFDVTVCITNGTDIISYPRKTFQDRQYSIWTCSATEISCRIPGFEEDPFLRFKVTLHGGSTSVPDQRNADDKSVQTPLHLDPSSRFEDLSRDFAKLLDGSSSHDVEMACGDHTFKAHRNVLSTRSDVFSAMLQSEMVEGKTGLVKIQDMEPDIFQQFLRYLYTGNLPELTVDTAKRFYEAGDKYAVEGLRQTCAGFLIDNLTRENACDILILAEGHSDLEFRESVIVYILKERIPFKDSKWGDFCDSHSKLANEVLNRFCELLRDK